MPGATGTTLDRPSPVAVRPAPGDLLAIDGRASVQFAGDRALLLRVVAVSQRPTYEGWVWLTGYVIDRSGDATGKREVFVQLAGLRLAPASTLEALRSGARPPSRA